jgi:hypothetical protein
MLAQSSTEIAEPKLVIPYTDRAEPMRKNDLIDIDDPTSRKSSMESAEPNRVMP